MIGFCCPVPRWFNHPIHREWADSGRSGFSGEPWITLRDVSSLMISKSRAIMGRLCLSWCIEMGPGWIQFDVKMTSCFVIVGPGRIFHIFFSDFNRKKPPAGWCSSPANLNWGMIWALTGWSKARPCWTTIFLAQLIQKPFNSIPTSISVVHHGTKGSRPQSHQGRQKLRQTWRFGPLLVYHGVDLSHLRAVDLLTLLQWLRAQAPLQMK